jgi:hypothetical protein
MQPPAAPFCSYPLAVRGTPRNPLATSEVGSKRAVGGGPESEGHPCGGPFSTKSVRVGVTQECWIGSLNFFAMQTYMCNIYMVGSLMLFVLHVACKLAHPKTLGLPAFPTCVDQIFVHD